MRAPPGAIELVLASCPFPLRCSVPPFPRLTTAVLMHSPPSIPLPRRQLNNAIECARDAFEARLMQMWENTQGFFGRDLLWVSCARCETFRVIPPHYGSYDAQRDTQLINGTPFPSDWECADATWMKMKCASTDTQSHGPGRHARRGALHEKIAAWWLNCSLRMMRKTETILRNALKMGHASLKRCRKMCQLEERKAAKRGDSAPRGAPVPLHNAEGEVRFMYLPLTFRASPAHNLTRSPVM